MTSNNEIIFEHFPIIRVLKDGHIHRFIQTDFHPPSLHPQAKVLSKDIFISAETNVAIRLYLPNNHHDNHKLPLMIYIHGGAFCIESAFSTFYHSYLTNLVAEANVIAVSVDYRLAPEHPITACYEDSWSALKWVVSNAEKNQESDSEPWLRDHADFSRTFLVGDSAGANIAHDMMVRVSTLFNSRIRDNETGVKIKGMALIHPYFGNKEEEKLWDFICKDGNYSSVDDPRFNPALYPNVLEKLVCEKILICTAEKDSLRDRGWSYYEAIKKSDWRGEVDILDMKGELHVFHLKNPGCDNATILLGQLADFIK